MAEVGGGKNDDTKLRMELIPPEAEIAIAKVMAFGYEKYGEPGDGKNWVHGMEWSRLYSAARRHLLKWRMGKTADRESGYSHLWHALASIAMLVAYEDRGVGADDVAGT